MELQTKKTENGRRVVKVQITPKILIHGITKGQISNAVECIEGLPEGARCVFTSFDEHNGCASFWFEHESFEEVPWQCEPPYINVVFRVLEGVLTKDALDVANGVPVKVDSQPEDLSAGDVGSQPHQ